MLISCPSLSQSECSSCKQIFFADGTADENFKSGNTQPVANMFVFCNIRLSHLMPNTLDPSRPLETQIMLPPGPCHDSGKASPVVGDEHRSVEGSLQTAGSSFASPRQTPDYCTAERTHRHNFQVQHCVKKHTERRN